MTQYQRQLLDAARMLVNNCKNNPTCKGCIFYHQTSSRTWVCRFGDTPNVWTVNEIETEGNNEQISL